MTEEIHQAAYRFQLEVEAGDRTVVGVNSFAEEGTGLVIEQPDYRALEDAQRSRLEAMRPARDLNALQGSLNRIRGAARSGENLLPSMILAAKSRATLGEISDVLRGEWGTYDEG